MSACIFCKIAAKEVPAKVIYEDDYTIAFHDLNPQAPVHVLIIPKKHIDKIASLEQSDTEIGGALLLAARKLASKQGWNDFRLVFNNGEQAGQTVFHIHLHLLSGRRMTWPPG